MQYWPGCSTTTAVSTSPIALYALLQLGASDARLNEYFAQWEERRALPRCPSPRAITGNQWRGAIGEADMFDALAAAFQHTADEIGADALIRDVFPVVADGIAAAAFHGLIRLAYGIETGHNGEIAAGLATLC